MIEFHTIDLNDVRLNYAEATGPGPALLILHGLTGSHAEFLHLVPELAQQAHVYLLDFRGHGRSGKAVTGYQLADYGRDVIAFLQQVVGQPAILLGHSLGGLVTTWLATNVPHLIRAVFLEDPALYVVQKSRFNETWFHAYFESLSNYLKDYHANGANFEEMVTYVGQTPVDENHTWLDVAGPEAVRDRARQLHQMDPAILEPIQTGMLFDGAGPDELLAQIQCPVHLLAAQLEMGGALSAQDVQRAVAQMPHSTHAVIENAGHDIHLDQPQAYLHEVKQFLATIERSHVQ